MRVMMLIKAKEDFEAGNAPSPQLMAAMGNLSEELSRAGVLRAQRRHAAERRPERASAIPRASAACVDGPFAETKELIGGYAIVNVPSKQDAVELAERVVAIHVECGERRDRNGSQLPLFKSGDSAAQAA